MRLINHAWTALLVVIIAAAAVLLTSLAGAAVIAAPVTLPVLVLIAVTRHPVGRCAGQR